MNTQWEKGGKYPLGSLLVFAGVIEHPKQVQGYIQKIQKSTRFWNIVDLRESNMAEIGSQKLKKLIVYIYKP